MGFVREINPPLIGKGFHYGGKEWKVIFFPPEGG